MGNPPGCLGWNTDFALPQYWATPAAWAGNRSYLYGFTVTWDYYFESTRGWVNAWGDIAIRTSASGGYWLVADVTPTALSPNQWHTLTARLDPSTTWRVGDTGGPVATPAEIYAALQNFEYFVIRAQATPKSPGDITRRLDNFRVVPEAGTLTSLGALFSMGIAWVWRRRNQA